MLEREGLKWIGLRREARAGRYYHNARKLAEIYRDVLWGLEYAYDETRATCVGMGYEDIREALDFLQSDFPDELTPPHLEDSVRSMLFTHGLIKIVDRAMAALKDYPECGERYFELLNRMYFIKYAYSDNDMMDALSVSRSTLYREKKRALSLLGVILWGYLLPGITKFEGEAQVTHA